MTPMTNDNLKNIVRDIPDFPKEGILFKDITPLLANPETRRLLSAGFAYEIPLGSTRTLQGNSDGEFHFYLTGATPIGCNWRWISGTGFRIPVDSVDESQMWYWSNHVDRNIFNSSWYVFGEMNWYQWIRSAT